MHARKDKLINGLSLYLHFYGLHLKSITVLRCKSVSHIFMTKIKNQLSGIYSIYLHLIINDMAINEVGCTI